ncbi:hypothetical protein SAMN05660666_02517 [Novosphingobium aromaticivorans]|uniref:hypothetical protein n=1 Tax=Novosphingobium aromaticivorans TaxID=48935 RepID=UPI00003C80B1|nr:hypothetical protein [Novosphingobium aromaticivorans]SCY69491.1 hypothetical protein SAMN05660666_02517 [Novosphingobium aromaticivorans]
MIRDLLMLAIPYEVRAHHGRFVTPIEQDTHNRLCERKAKRVVYQAAQVKP